ncbi:MAG: amino acid racemase [Desulfobacterales bacterium]|nr:amino acid racemase [Desulfobacterales bacterium]
MSGNEEKTAGILGGMGPEATVDLMQRIIALTPALDDADHVRCIVDNNPKVPSRIKAIIEGHGEDPGPCMADMGQRLETWGADFLVIACNTAHHYYPAVREAVDIPVIHLVGLVTDHIMRVYPDHKNIGILASPAVNMTGLYTEKFTPKGLRDVWPDEAHQAQMLDVIKSVKKGDTGPEVVEQYQAVCSHLAEKGATLVVVACTELSALDSELPVEAVDAAQVLAREIVDVAKNKKSISTYDTETSGA